jgi:hypothetical protein
MRRALLGLAPFLAAAAVSLAAQAEPTAENLSFAVMRNGEKIGTTTLNVARDGAQTVAQVSTHIAVKFAFVTVYRFDQQETERWAGGRLIALAARTDDNGTVHNVAARRDGNALSVDVDGRVSLLDPATITASPWNPSIVRTRTALNPQDGKLTPVSAVDLGQQELIVDGRPTLTHHYSIRTNFPQDVWYDSNQRLIKVEMHGSDGSTIRYQPLLLSQAG